MKTVVSSFFNNNNYYASIIGLTPPLHLSVGTIQRTSLKNWTSASKYIDRLAKKFDFLSSFGKTFECIICRDICKKPVVAGCCRRVIGCDACISRWDTQNSTCPLCLCELSQRWQLRGLDDMLLLANNILCEDKDLPLPPEKELDSSDSDFEPPPPIRFVSIHSDTVSWDLNDSFLYR